MAVQQPSPSSDATGEGNVRKRVCKACDRCRLKKSKCDGTNPCSRCKTDNAICFFGERKRSHDKVYPKGYVEMLEQQQEQLVTGLQELYRRFQSGEGRAGSPLADAGSGHPLTHDILQYLGALRPDRGGSDGGFEEDLSLMQQRLFENGAAPMIRHASSDTESDHTQSSPYDSISGPNSVFKNSFDSTEAPQTPPTNDPFPPIAATTETPRKRPDPFVHPLKMHSNMDLDQFQRQHWASSLADFAPSPDLQFLQNSVSPGTFNMAAAQINRQSMPLGSAGPCLIPEWNEDEEFKALLDQGVA